MSMPNTLIVTIKIWLVLPATASLPVTDDALKYRQTPLRHWASQLFGRADRVLLRLSQNGFSHHVTRFFSAGHALAAPLLSISAN
jgi:hypothetical protein